MNDKKDLKMEYQWTLSEEETGTTKANKLFESLETAKCSWDKQGEPFSTREEEFANGKKVIFIINNEEVIEHCITTGRWITQYTLTNLRTYKELHGKDK